MLIRRAVARGLRPHRASREAYLQRAMRERVGVKACASARTSFSSSAASFRAGRGRRPPSRPGLVRVGGVALNKASEEFADDAAIEAEAPHPYVSRGGVKLAAALDAFAARPRRARLPRRRRLDRRLHRRAAQARRGDAWSRSTSAADSSTRASPPIRASARSKVVDARVAHAASSSASAPRRDRLRRKLHLAAARAAACADARRATGVARQPRQAAIRGRAGPRSSRAGSGARRRLARACAEVRACVEARGLDGPRPHRPRRSSAAAGRGNSCSRRRHG